MKLDLVTVVFVVSLAGLAQSLGIFVQYRLNSAYRGIGWWLFGSLAMSMGWIAHLVGVNPSHYLIGALANPLLILAKVCTFIGIAIFTERKVHLAALATVFAGVVAAYLYFLFFAIHIGMRTIIVSAAVAAFSLLCAACLLSGKREGYRESARFTGAMFLVQGLFLVLVALYTPFGQRLHTYHDFALLQVMAFIVPVCTSTLWTSGMILMVNQRLSAQNAEERDILQQVFNTSPDAAVITRSVDDVIIDVNEGFTAISGHARAETLGHTASELGLWIRPADRRVLRQRLLAEHGCEHLETPFRRRDGRHLLGLVSARPITKNGRPHFITVVRDITERKQAEEALRESEATYRSILDASPDDITITDAEGRILMLSPAAERMFGYRAEEVIGRPMLDFLAPEERLRAGGGIERLLSGTGQGTREYRAVHRDQSVLDIEVKSSLIRGQHGQPAKMVFIVRDISERRRAEAEKAELEARNRQMLKAESLGRMAGAIAHHFNNQLQAVMGNLELAQGLAPGGDPAPCLGNAKLATERAAEVSRMMLAYLGKASREPEPLSLGEFCRRSLPVLLATLPKTVDFQADCPVPGPVIHADANQVQEVLSGLLSNAWEAVAPGRGRVRLALGLTPAAQLPGEHRVPVDWQPRAEDYACLEVADNGCGIAAEDLEKLFDPFFSTKFTGRGLGLSVLLGAVQAHGGMVSVASTPGQGSTFRVYFPVLAEVPAAAAGGPGPAPGPPWGGCILLVDDDPIVLTTTGALLERMGFALLTAGDGEQALALYRQHQAAIRCVITDLSMPRMDGWQTLSALRQVRPDLPVILVSGYAKGQVLASEAAEQPQAVLEKPFRFQQLQKALEQALGGGTKPAA